MRELFERIMRDKTRIALASSAKEDELKRYKEIAQIDLIAEETSSDDVERSKFVGDTPYDAAAES